MMKAMFEINPDKKLLSTSLQDSVGHTPLHRAAALDRFLIVEFLIEQVQFSITVTNNSVRDYVICYKTTPLNHCTKKCVYRPISEYKHCSLSSVSSLSDLSFSSHLA